MASSSTAAVVTIDVMNEVGMCAFDMLLCSNCWVGGCLDGWMVLGEYKFRKRSFCSPSWANAIKPRGCDNKNRHLNWHTRRRRRGGCRYRQAMRRSSQR